MYIRIYIHILIYNLQFKGVLSLLHIVTSTKILIFAIIHYREKILDPLSEGGYEPGDGPERFPDYEGVNPFNETPGNASMMGERDRFLKARI